MNLLENGLAIAFAVILVGMVGWIVLLIVSALGPRMKKKAPTGPKPVDNYTIAHSDGNFPNVLVTFQLDDRSEHGPFAFVPPFAHMLADELTIASIRAAPKRRERATLIAAALGGEEEDTLVITDDGVNGRGGLEHG